MIADISPSPLSQVTPQALVYQSGFGNEYSTEVLKGALPVGCNSPQRCPYGLYAEQLSGTAFTAPRHANRRTWTYRIRPSATHGTFEPLHLPSINASYNEAAASPNALRWNPLPIPDSPTDFLDGLLTFGGNGSAQAHSGCAIYLFAANQSMQDRFFYDADGELLIVPQAGRLVISTELGKLEIDPSEIALIPRGIRFKVELVDESARGYVCENFGASFKLPDLGPIGSNGLANARDFQAPVAWYEDNDRSCQLIGKFQGSLWSAMMDHSPLDVVGWHGSHAPVKYDLRRFNAIGSISYDHPDPSIFLVLHSPSDTPGVSNIDFVVFPPRWLAAESTFRPPWFHRNIASEFMGLIHGVYDAKAGGFLPGGASLHNGMTAHGPDAETYEKAIRAQTSRPDRISNTLAFMFESRHVITPSRFARGSSLLQRDYAACWRSLQSHFDPARP